MCVFILVVFVFATNEYILETSSYLGGSSKNREKIITSEREWQNERAAARRLMMEKHVEFVQVPAVLKEATFRHDSTIEKRAKREKKTSSTHTHRVRCENHDFDSN